MLQFQSSQARIVNTIRCVNECIDIAIGNDYSSVNLLIYHASLGHNYQEILSESKRIYPSADVVVASCCGVVGCEGVSESMKDMALMAITGEDYALVHTDDFYGHNAYDQTLKLSKALKAKDSDISMIYFVGSGIDTDNDAVITAFEEEFGEEVTIFGATTSDNMKGIVNYQCINDSVYEHGAFAIGFSDPSLKVYTRGTHGFVADGKPMVVTKATNHIIHELDHRPAWTVYTEKLNLSPKATCGDTIPIGALAEALDSDSAQEYGNNHILRVVTKHEGNDMYYATSIKEGTNLWLTIRDEELIFDEMTRMTSNLVQQIGDEHIEAVFHADCLARGRFLFGRVFKEELVAKMQMPFYTKGKCPPWLGMYGFGEFARLAGKNTYQNYTTSLYVITRIKPK